MKLIPADRHLQPSKRLLVGVAVLAALSTGLLWPAFHRLALLAWLLWAPVFALALRYVAGSWLRVSVPRGLSWKLALPFRTVLGSVELHAADIREFRLDTALFARLLGLWTLQVVPREGAPHPPLRFFPGMDRLAEELHAYLQQR
ncbi:MAG: hypothetical protein U0P81_13575 [Holophagaceae bacterium]